MIKNKEAKMNNITKWLKSITQEQFREFFMIRDYECTNCPAKNSCDADQDDKCCEEEFYKWSMLEPCSTMEGGD